MKTTIFGAGAVGGHLAARLGAAGAEVTAVARGAQLAAIQERGLTLHIKDERYQRPENAGVASLVAGIALTSADDDERLARATATFDQLYEVFARKHGG